MTKKPAYGILIRVSNHSWPSSDKFARFFADVITFGEDGTPRNCSDLDVEKDYKYYPNFTATCFVSSDNDDYYGARVEYFDPYVVDMNTAEKMYKTLKKVNNKLRKYNNDFGSYKTFGEYVSRFAKAVGAKLVVFYDDYDAIHSNYKLNSYREYKPGEAVKIIDDFVERVQDDLRQQNHCWGI